MPRMLMPGRPRGGSTKGWRDFIQQWLQESKKALQKGII